MENTSSVVAENPSEEVDRLQEELFKANERLQVWKEKTQMGVNKLRARIVELTEEVEELRLANKSLVKQTPCASPSEEMPLSFSPLSMGVWCVATEWLTTCADIFESCTLQKSSLLLEEMTSSDSALRELEKCQRRAAQAIRLQSKNLEALQKEISTLREDLSASAAALKDRNHAVENRDKAIAMLQDRLDEVDAANARLKASSGMAVKKPNADQLSLFEERLQADMEFLRREFASREVAIFEQHRDEMERLIAAHEEEMSAMRNELEETAARPVAGFPIKVEGEMRKEAEDTAYAELLGDLEAMRKEVNEVRAENQRLTSECKLRNARDSIRAPVVNGFQTRPNPETMSEAIARIAELESDMHELSQEHCEVKKRLIAVTHQASSKDAGQRIQALEAQQLSYLRFVVVRVLCSIHDENMVMNLFPVLSTLLHFDSDNLGEIYVAHPNWKKREF